MRIDIMIDKELKISLATMEALESELYRNLRPLCPKTGIACVREARMAWS